MRLLLLLFLAVCIVAYPIYDDDEDEIEELSNAKPRVAWVPIVSRSNVSAAVGEVLQGEDERFGRIGKMLGDSYDQWNRDAQTGEVKMRQLEQRRNSVSRAVYPVAILFSLLF